MNDKFEKDEIVIIDYSQYGRMNFRKGKIIEVTKAGNYKVLEDGKEKYEIFTPFGKLRGDKDWNSTYIRKFSQDLWDKFLRQQEKLNIIYKIQKVVFKNFNIEDLREIEKIIKKYENEE